MNPTDYHTDNTKKMPYTNPYQKNNIPQEQIHQKISNTSHYGTPITMQGLRGSNYHSNQVTNQDLRIRQTLQIYNTNKHLEDLNIPPHQSHYIINPQTENLTTPYTHQQVTQTNNKHILHHTPTVGTRLFSLTNDNPSSIYEAQHLHTAYADTLQPIPITQTPLGCSNEINLAPELETLRQVIASQHIALKAHIIDLGILSLNLTNTIVKKKESSLKLKLEDRIPRSLRIKCELTTSPEFEDNPKYLSLKKNLQNIISNCITQGLEVMKEWSTVNIDLLIKDRCYKVMEKLTDILLGLYSYWEDILHPIHWPNTIHNKIPLLLIKIYFDSDYITDLDKIINFFELSAKEILCISTQLITKNPNHDLNSALIETIDVETLQHLDIKQTTLITEVLTSFDQILKSTTLDLWQANYSRLRQLEASHKLKANLEGKKKISATATTAKALNKAIEQINENNTSNLMNNIRITSMEKQLLHYKQRSNEIINQLKQQKNSRGSQLGPLTSKKHTFGPYQEDIIDLTNVSSQSPQKYYIPPYKKQRNIQWDTPQDQIIQFNPSSAPRHTINTHTVPFPVTNTTGPPTPIQTFGRSNTLQTPQITQPQSPFTKLHHTDQNRTPKNPFLPPQPRNNLKQSGRRGGRARGASRGLLKRP